MTKIISDAIKEKMKKENEVKVKEIRTNIKDNFIQNYNKILNNEELKNYIVNIFGNNLLQFYKNDNIINPL